MFLFRINRDDGAVRAGAIHPLHHIGNIQLRFANAKTIFFDICQILIWGKSNDFGLVEPTTVSDTFFYNQAKTDIISCYLPATH